MTTRGSSLSLKRARPHAARRSFYSDPASSADAARCGAIGMQLNLRVLRTLAQAQKGAMLALAEQARLRASEHERKPCQEVGARRGTNLRLYKLRKRRVAMVEEDF